MTNLNQDLTMLGLHNSKHHNQPMKTQQFVVASLYFLFACATFITLFQIHSLHFAQPSPSVSASRTLLEYPKCENLTRRLSKSVTFLPLKDLRFADKPHRGHTWFMSSTHDTREDGEVQHQQFPSKASDDRLLCLKGNDTHDGSWNYYALAWSDALPVNASFMTGLTFVSYNHYDYDNIWHGLSAFLPFVAWSTKNMCASPARWVLYHWGETRSKMSPWLRNLTAITYGTDPYIETFNGVSEGTPVCFENAVVMRHNEGGMSRERRMEAYDVMRCKARVYCNVSRDRESEPLIGLTLLMRTGPRSFQNESATIRIFEQECEKVKGCRLMVAYSNNLTLCEQVKVMSMTDILVSPHGAQLTNMFLMDRNSSVMEFFPKGWLNLAGVGQYVYHWIASWSGMKHQGAWRDKDGENCPYPETDRRCMSFYKNGRIGYNETYFGEWTRNVLSQVTKLKSETASTSPSNVCTCS